MRVWIEIPCEIKKKPLTISFTLLWGCGLKCPALHVLKACTAFHPLMRVWIEIDRPNRQQTFCYKFHPLMRVWIEIKGNPTTAAASEFHPLMRVWIEISTPYFILLYGWVSPSYEGVDWNNFNWHSDTLKASFTLLWGCGLKLKLSVSY